MGYFFKSDGLKSYTSQSDSIAEWSHTTAWDDSTGKTLVSSQSGFLSSYANSSNTSIFFSDDGLKMFVAYTYFDGSEANVQYVKEHSLSTAWLLSSGNTTATTTITVPLGTEWDVNSTGYSSDQIISGLEFASDGLSFHVLRYEESGVSTSITSLLVYTLTTAWTLSSATLSSTTTIDILTGGDNIIRSPISPGYHTMSGGEIVLAYDGNFVEITAITDTAAVTSNPISTGSFFFSSDETKLFQNGDCGWVYTNIATDYTSSTVTLTSFASSLGNKTITTVCGYSITETYYHDGDYVIPDIGDSVYSDSGGTISLSNSSYQVGLSQYITTASGVVASTGFCI
tara:strand:+ start:105 stop:1130 length:1026 start_codon:yes stop_codon:yes gene_type:complete